MIWHAYRRKAEVNQLKTKKMLKYILLITNVLTIKIYDYKKRKVSKKGS